MNFRSKGNLAPVGFQLVPMLDIVFNLLFFFVTVQVYSQWESEIEIALPTAKTSQTPQRLPGEIIVNITKDGETIVNGRVLVGESLGDMLRQVAQLFPGQPVLIRADKTTDYEHVIRVLDLCRQADIWNISFATLVPET